MNQNQGTSLEKAKAEITGQENVISALAGEIKNNTRNFSLAKAAKLAQEERKNKHQASGVPLMTKALINRVVKEQKAKQENMHWEQLVGLHNQVVSYMYSVTTLQAFLRNPILMRHVQQKDRLLEIIKVLTKDIRDIHTRAMACAAMYPKKSGEIIDDEEMLKAIGIYETYGQILIDITDVVMPQSNEAMEIITVAERIVKDIEDRILADQAAAAASEQAVSDLVNPEVISDITPIDKGIENVK